MTAGFRNMMARLGIAAGFGLRTTATTTTTPATTAAGDRATTTTTTATTRPVRATNEKWYPDHAILSGATKDSLKSMTEFKYN